MQAMKKVQASHSKFNNYLYEFMILLAEFSGHFRKTLSDYYDSLRHDLRYSLVI